MLIGTVGKTAHYRMYMKFFNGIVFEMGEQVFAKPVRDANLAKLGRNPKRKLSLKSNWIEATWVRFDTRTNEHNVVAAKGGPALRIRTARAKPESERWNIEAIRQIVATPDKPNPHDEKQRSVQSERNTKGIDFGAKPGHDIKDSNEDTIKLAQRLQNQ